MGFGHPRYVHGYYSSFFVDRFTWRQYIAWLRAALIAAELEALREAIGGPLGMERIRQVYDAYRVSGRTLMRWAGVTPTDLLAWQA